MGRQEEKKGGKKGTSKASAKHDSCFLYVSAKFTSNYFEAKSSKFLVLSQNSEFYGLQKCQCQKVGFLCFGAFKNNFPIFKILIQEKKRNH